MLMEDIDSFFILLYTNGSQTINGCSDKAVINGTMLSGPLVFIPSALDAFRILLFRFL